MTNKLESTIGNSEVVDHHDDTRCNDANEAASGLSRSSNQPWRIESNGIRQVPEEECSGGAWDLFWVWFAANIGILGLVLGAIVLSFGLNFWQSLIAIAGGTVVSFSLVSMLSLASWKGRVPMMTISRAIFGLYGNFIPTLVSWVSLVGWETIAVITGTLAMMALLGMAIHAGTVTLGLASLVVVAGLSIAFSILGQATLVVVQKWGSYLLGIMTVGILVEILTRTSFHALISQRGGSWLDGVVPAFSIVVAGTGLSWANAAGDYSRYTSASTRGRSIFWGVLAGGSIPLVVLMITGVLLGARDPHIATATNPVAAIQHVLPSWMYVPYLITAVGGLIVEADLSLYSSGLNLLNMFVPLKRYKSVFIDACIMLGGTVYVVFFSSSFFQPFESFIILLGVGLAAWAGIFVAGQLRFGCALQNASPGIGTPGIGMPGTASPNTGMPGGDSRGSLFDPKCSTLLVRKGIGWPGVIAWTISAAIGLLFTTSPFFSGPLAKGIFADSSLEILISFAIGGIAFYVLSLFKSHSHKTGLHPEQDFATRSIPSEQALSDTSDVLA